MQMNTDKSLPPTTESWGITESNPDLASAMEIFLGKTNDEVFPLLERNYLIRCLDLIAMPDQVFSYYGNGFAEFILEKVPDDERFGVFLGAFLDATSKRRELSPSFWLDFWRKSHSFLERFSGRLSACKMNTDTKAELTEELGEIRLAISPP